MRSLFARSRGPPPRLARGLPSSGVEPIGGPWGCFPSNAPSPHGSCGDRPSASGATMSGGRISVGRSVVESAWRLRAGKAAAGGFRLRARESLAPTGYGTAPTAGPLRIRRIAAIERLAPENFRGLFSRQCLVLQERPSECMQFLAVLGDHGSSLALGLFDNPTHLGVDQPRGIFRYVPGAGDGAAEKNLLLVVAVAQSSQSFAHAPLRHHPARHVGRLLDIVGSAGCHVLQAE